MKAAVYHQFSGNIQIEDVSDPTTPSDGVVIEVKATGICRSDWWGWQGNDNDIILPHVPGHEFAGVVIETGREVKNWFPGDRVTVPFVCGCGNCPQCKSGNQQVCDHQFQPGFTAWGSFAKYVAIQHADENLVRLPDEMDFTTAASLGCRMITSYRALVHRAKIKPGESLAIHGCGGVGLSALLIAKALDVHVIAVDISSNKLEFAKELGADQIIKVEREMNVPSVIHSITNGGVNVSIDALGLPKTCLNSIHSLSKSGRHVQVGLMESETPNVSLPMNKITGNELVILGSHGMQAHKYPEIFELIRAGKLQPEKMITDILDLKTGTEILMGMHEKPPLGVAVVDLQKNAV